MAAGIHEPDGHAAGRVTIVTTLMSVLPTVVTCLIIVGATLAEIIPPEIALPLLLTSLAQGSATTGTVFETAKHTKTDQARTIWGSAPVADMVTPPMATPAPTATNGAPYDRDMDDYNPFGVDPADTNASNGSEDAPKENSTAGLLAKLDNALARPAHRREA